MRCPWRKGLASPNERASQRCEPLLRPEPTHPTAEGFSSFGAGTPVQPDATHGEDTIENRARGREAANGAASTDDIDIRHAAVDCDAARPRALPRMASCSYPRGGSRRGAFSRRLRSRLREQPPLQFVPVELTKAEHLASLAPSPPDIRIELERGGLRLKLQCAASAVPQYAALLRALADTMALA